MKGNIKGTLENRDITETHVSRGKVHTHAQIDGSTHSARSSGGERLKAAEKRPKKSTSKDNKVFPVLNRRGNRLW